MKQLGLGEEANVQINEHLPTFLQNVRATPQTPEQQRFFVVPQREVKHNTDKNRGNMDHGNGPEHEQVSRKHEPWDCSTTMRKTRKCMELFHKILN
ncbi:hypothetical protein AVEN_206653-1 [Araneus ventricosus]|uniref:Uncharacterized protein n=1 Tax=Araneus ventricosus TaxID=182803 RepID=A0A4Y2H675_ARAVE|nr:hypothetical protein AVEN_206653-1 [Araneus ventricosus]